ncbi:N-terminal acetyltransferase A, auxiliary subunit [Trema orientale]|uniref:N-terminal acetyltransferase A, auxiliary subunit n=1 Tax=Trema orientale TaxID=63057 RepID=A0A2P5AQX2_TREOI|nr:N-terminal acetyltransferase A, auxiliary subunit [Trema orientale]
MSPAAVDARSPNHKPSPPLPNPSSVPESPLNFSAVCDCGPDRDVPEFARSGSAVPPGRSRPRLVKVRRQIGSTSRAGSSEVGPGFYPFRSSNEVSVSSSDNGNMGFVFGASKSGFSEGLDSGQGQFSGGGIDPASSNIRKGTEFKQNENVGFVFGAKVNGLRTDFSGKNERFNGNGKEVASDDNGNTKTEPEPACGSFGSVSNSNTGKTEWGEFAKNSNSDDCGKKKHETQEAVCVEHGDAGFVFGANPNGLVSNLKSEKCDADFSKSFEQSRCNGSNAKIDHETEDRKSSCSDFVFGSSWCNSESNLSSEKRDSVENIEKQVPGAEPQTEFQKVEAVEKANTNGNWSLNNDSGVFVFGSSSRIGTSLNELREAKSGDEARLNSENLGSCNSTVGAQDNVSGPEVDGKCECRYESSGNIACGSSTSSAFKLPDEMRKLNINDSANVRGAEKTEISNSKSFFNAETASSSRRYRKFSKGCSKVSNFSSRCVQTNSFDKGSKVSFVDVEVTNGSSSVRSEESHVFESCSKAAYASGMCNSVCNSEPFTFQAGLGESANVGQFHKNQEVNDTEANVASSQPSFSTNSPEFQPSASEAASVGVEKENTKNSPSSPDGFGVSSVDLKTPICDPSSLKESLFPKLNKRMEFTVKNRSIKDKRFRETKHKLKKSSVKQRLGQDQTYKESSSQENPISPGCYSPMDFSPYQEITVTDQHSSEISAKPDGSFHQDNNCRTCSSDAPVPADLKVEDLGLPEKGLYSDRGDQESKELTEENFGYYSERSFILRCSSPSKAEFACSSVQMEQADGGCGTGVASLESIANYSSDVEKQENSPRMQFNFTSGLEDVKGKSFMFSATSARQERLSARKYRRRRKSRIGVGRDSSVNPSSNQSSSNATDKFEAGKQFNQYSSSSAEIHEACEKWRLRGNQSYRKGDLSKAEEFYTQGIISVPLSERSGSCLKPLLLCYSNRAAARMCLLRIREAIGDCMMAAALDPSFLKAQVRAANCHLVLGEVENALQFFNKCLEIGAGVCLDRRIILDAVDGQQKAQKVADCIDQSTKLLEQKNPDAALSALEIISEALLICLYSEKLLKMKAEALIMLRRHEEAIQLCEQSLSFAEKNFSSVYPSANVYGSPSERHSFVRLWRWCLISKSYFYLGRFEAALPLLDKLKQVGSTNDEAVSKDMDSSASLAVTIRDLLHHKNAGNEAFKSGKYSEAVDHYTVALSSSIESRRFAAICFCNRAAANQALGQICDAIADCSLAIALDGSYAKAVSRRATLHEMIRDYGQAASDLRRLISILVSQSSDNTKEYSSSGRSMGSVKDLRQAQMRLPIMEEAAKKVVSLDFYLILGSKQTDTSPDIKKAYRKAALRHHPDKAGQSLARSDSGDEGRLWKEISQEVHNDADRLFKMIGEAYAVLSDSDTRSQYDLDEELRKASKRSNGSSSHGRHSDAYSSESNNSRRHDYQSSPFERSSYRRNFRDNWKTYGSSYSRWPTVVTQVAVLGSGLLETIATVALK